MKKPARSSNAPRRSLTMRVSANCCSSAPRRAFEDDVEGKWADEYFGPPFGKAIKSCQSRTLRYSIWPPRLERRDLPALRPCFLRWFLQSIHLFHLLPEKSKPRVDVCRRILFKIGRHRFIIDRCVKLI